RPGAALDRRDDLLLRPGPEPGRRIGREIGPMEDTEARDLEADLRAAEKTRHVRLAEKIARGVTVEAASERHQVFAARDLLLLVGRGGARRHSGGHRQGGDADRRQDDEGFDESVHDICSLWDRLSRKGVYARLTTGHGETRRFSRRVGGF